MRRHLASLPAKLLLAVVLLIGGCAYEKNRAPLVAPVARNETFGLTPPPAPAWKGRERRGTAYPRAFRRITARNASPYRLSLTDPTPLSAVSALRPAGRYCTISRSVVSWKIT
jgi:hypothetical protein